MRYSLQLTVAFLAVILFASTATAYDYTYEHDGTVYEFDYGYDPAKAMPSTGGNMYYELARDPAYMYTGEYAGKYEYYFDLYTTGGTFYLTDIVGLDNGKIANAQTERPGGGTLNTQRWGDPNGMYDAWPASTGRIMDMWSKSVNASQSSASAFDYWVSSYDDGSGGWTGGGLGYSWAGTDNPHSYAEYVSHTWWPGGEGVWKAELTGPGQPVHWYYTQFGIVPAEDTIYMPGNCLYWAPSGATGLVLTLRVIYDDVIDPDTIGWSMNATKQYDILGNFDVSEPFAGDCDLDGDVDWADYQALEVGFGVGTTWAEGDFDGDGDVDWSDYQELEANFGAGTSGIGNLGSGEPVPEPMTLSVLALGAAGLLASRRKRVA